MAEYRDNLVPVLDSDFARELYDSVKDLPVIDYHCHLSPREIYEDKPFTDIGEMWLAADHYKWRLMRACGIDEKYITGDACYKDKFMKFADAVSVSMGNPVCDWVAMELKTFFDIDLAFNPENAARIWDSCNEAIARSKFSPRKAIAMAKVEYIATTDDPCDDLRYHALLAEENYGVKVTPSFRTDALVSVDAQDYGEYIAKLSASSGVDIKDYASFKDAVCSRLDFFLTRGCRFSDVGVEGFPSRIGDDESAGRYFDILKKGERLTPEQSDALRGNMYVFLAREYARRGIVMQLHLSVTRNSNEAMFAQCGRDSGFDCVGKSVETSSVRAVLNAAQNAGGLPRTVIYSLNPSSYYELVTLCGAFRGVVPGISWWFNDHRRGITQTLACVAELSSIDSLVGMLTDSRSFLSYPRHDYYRRLVCRFLADVTPVSAKLYAVKVARDLCYYNAKALVEDRI